MTGAEILFDPDLTVFFGHSQGATVGLPALAVDDVAVEGPGVGKALLQEHGPEAVVLHQAADDILSYKTGASGDESFHGA